MITDLNILGVDQAIKRLQNGADGAISRAVFKVANVMETTAKKNIKQSVYSTTPPAKPFQRTGKAQQSITTSKINAFQTRVFMGVDYGQYLEKGTGIYNNRSPFWTTFGGLLSRPIKYEGMQARPFWKPAIEATKRQVPEIFKSELEKI